MLNWDVLPENDRALHAIAGIPESEVIITMMAIGNYPDDLSVAMSERRALDEVLHFHS